MKRLLSLLAVLAVSPLWAQTAANPTNYPDPSVDTCEVLTWNGTDATGLGFVGTNLCWDQSRTSWMIDGAADQVQWIVQGHSTQTSDTFVVEQSDGTDLFAVDNDGRVTFTTPAVTTEAFTIFPVHNAAGHETTYDFGIIDSITSHGYGFYGGTDEEEGGLGAHNLAGTFCQLMKFSGQAGTLSGIDDVTCGTGSGNTWQLINHVDADDNPVLILNKGVGNTFGWGGEAGRAELYAVGAVGDGTEEFAISSGFYGMTGISMFLKRATVAPSSAAATNSVVLWYEEVGVNNSQFGYVDDADADPYYLVSDRGTQTISNKSFSGSTTFGTLSDPAENGDINGDNGTTFLCQESSPASTSEPCIGFDSSEVLQVTNGTIDGADLTAVSVTPTQVSAALNTQERCFVKLDPATDDEIYTVWRAPTAVTLTEIYCEVTGGTSVLFDFEVDDGTPTGVNGGDITCTTSGVTDSSLGGDTAMADGDRLDIDMGTVTGSVTNSAFCIQYTID